jgi:hypothetical protein
MVLDRQLKAILCHHTMLANMVHQMLLEAQTLESRTALLQQVADGGYGPLFETRLVEATASRGAAFGLAAAETLRCHGVHHPERQRMPAELSSRRDNHVS